MGEGGGGEGPGDREKSVQLTEKCLIFWNGVRTRGITPSTSIRSEAPLARWGSWGGKSGGRGICPESHKKKHSSRTKVSGQHVFIVRFRFVLVPKALQRQFQLLPRSGPQRPLWERDGSFLKPNFSISSHSFVYPSVHFGGNTMKMKDL